MAKAKNKAVTRKPLFQWCIRETYVDEVLGLDKGLSIDSLTFEIGFSLKRVVSAIPSNLRTLGVSSLREPSTSMEAFGTLHGARSKMIGNAKSICSNLSLDFRHMRVRRLQLSMNGTTAFFTRMTKNFDMGEDNNTKRIKVMGLVKYEGDEKGMNHIIKALTARKLKCVYSVKPVTTVICSE